METTNAAVAEQAIGQEPVPLPVLTSLRFFAAFLVVAHHNLALHRGYSGVTFFFILSGFILAVNYSGRSLRGFHAKRFARIYPAHLLTALLALPLIGAVGWWQNLTLTQSWWHAQPTYFSLNPVAWSLSNEAFFYALFPALLWAAMRWPRAVAVCVGLSFAGLVGVALAFPVSDPHYWFYLFPPARLPEFALGVILGIGFTRRRAPIAPVWELPALVLVALSFLFAGHAGEALAYSVAFVPAYALVIHVFADGRGPVARLLRHRWLLVLGESSFMLYMVQYLLARYVLRWTGWAHGNFLISVPLALLLSVLLWRWFEQPARRWLVRRLAAA